MLTDIERELVAEWRATIGARQIPDYMVQGLADYVSIGLPPGDFLQAVLANNFVDAVCRADENNALVLREYALTIYNDCPSKCWGSRDAVAEWIRNRGLLQYMEETTDVKR